MAGPNPRVLVTDDEKIITDTLVMILNSSGFNARPAYSGEMAVELARGFQPDILITDVVMLGMTGIEVAIQMKSMLPSCKVVLFSGQAATADLLEIAENEGYQFEILSKPIHPQELLAKLRKILPSI